MKHEENAPPDHPKPSSLLENVNERHAKDIFSISGEGTVEKSGRTVSIKTINKRWRKELASKDINIWLEKNVHITCTSRAHHVSVFLISSAQYVQNMKIVPKA